MELEDLFLVSIDDHVIEPPDLFEGHVPAKYADVAPRVERMPDGSEQWVFLGEAIGTFGMSAVASWPREEWSYDPVGFAEMRPGCYDIHARIDDMNVNGILASMCFPTMAGFNGRGFFEAHDQDLGLVMLQSYNDWHIDEWCGTYPGRFIPLAIVPMWDVNAAVAEVRRVAKKGCRGISFVEAPHALGLPSFQSGHWDPLLEAIVEEGCVLCLHIGVSGRLVTLAPEAPQDQFTILATQLSLMVANDLLWGPTFRRFPELKVALSEGGIGWIPFYLDRCDRHYENRAKWHGQHFDGKLPSEVFREHILACFITDPSGLRSRERIGIDIIAWECDFPHSDSTWPYSPEFLFAELEQAGITDASEINAMTFENACRFFAHEPFENVARGDATVGALRARAADVETRDVSRAEWCARYTARTGIEVPEVTSTPSPSRHPNVRPIVHPNAAAGG